MGSSVHGNVWLMWPNIACFWDGSYCPKPGCVAPRFLFLTFRSPGGELAVVVRLPTVFFRWLGAIQNYLPILYQMNGFGKASRQGVQTHPPMVLSTMVQRDKSVGLLLGGGTWAVAGCRNDVVRLAYFSQRSEQTYPDRICRSSGCDMTIVRV
ncbi:hypothetical protein CK203_077739 [Vitis vinifera]|uniref:Uncharacterized protein n=1 Tax=Vitis vinifera TaxID=29760 RepID=A0A438BX15_VITVI|nr:hypothetical protein CK203_077739 [Vitis vinifera]